MGAEETERRALLCDREAILQVVSALRRYRAIVIKTLDSRYRDGECDAVQLSNLQFEVEEIEESLKEEE